MSRIAKKPVEIPKGVEITIDGLKVTAKGSKGTLSTMLHKDVEIKQEERNVLSGIINEIIR